MRKNISLVSFLCFFMAQASACDLAEADRAYRVYDASYAAMKSHDDEIVTKFMSEQAKDAFRAGVEKRKSTIRGNGQIQWAAGVDPEKGMLLLLQKFRGLVPENAKASVSGNENQAQIEYHWSTEDLFQKRKSDSLISVSHNVRFAYMICQERWLVDREEQSSEETREWRLDGGGVEPEATPGGKVRWHFP
ncbi:MAG: hypothetical protein ACOY33_01250 [Pseudomonadota bacterium]